MMRLWSTTGLLSYWFLWPAIYVYSFLSKPRARVIVTHGSEVLLVKNWLGPGNWTLPGGGLERHEPAEHAARRELKEELGLDVAEGAMQVHGKHTFKGRGNMLVKCYLFSINYQSRPSLVHKTNEIMDSCWMEIDEAIAAESGLAKSVPEALAVWKQA